MLLRFLCTVAAYLIGGIAYNKFSGATGVELIPNYEVWKNFPSDVMVCITFCKTLKQKKTPFKIRVIRTSRA